ncbi:1,4-dihydroxy-2-naphthoyl-CoA hydrolase [Synechococcales cyanobacterium C]|uniref:1,4-dihydroxy-2-naphthoyl-CoA hydrolase n=1 Tax=Petrachloros mirabilis ULC683 TaxID=2781853 RepID=A0A8K2A1Z1_9CYAN|nr:thioesterase family protein [Petrachloros mirabilis]NCJ08228.1 1,4-dihydroxy-2-naphthoyl-CoA hydrolase [Petrachloros mirabilis ULC683]
MPFTYTRTIRFQDTDAAGVIYFTNTLAICHEAYEESLMASGIEIWKFFSNSAIAIPIVHANVDFFRPAFCGDEQQVRLTPDLLTPEEFQIDYEIATTADPDRLVSKAITRHVCINPINRQRKPLPEDVLAWLKRWSHGE